MMSFTPRLALEILAATVLTIAIGVPSRGGAKTGDVAILPPIVGTTELRSSDGLTGFGLGGQDPVTYFLEAEPRFGLAAYETVWGGVAWRFVSAANRAAFQRDPEAFLPRIGGYDAMAAATGRVVSASPFIFARDGARLYVFRTEATRQRFVAERDAAALAERQWVRLRAGLVGS